MKQLYTSLFLLGLCCLGNIAGAVSVGTQIDSNIFDSASNDIQKVELKFCENDAKSKTYIIAADEQQELCLEINNNSSKDINVFVDFVDGTFTNDQRKNRACLNNDEKKHFGQYVSGVISPLLVPAKASLVQHPMLKFPKGSKGDILGCVVYYTKGASIGGITDFNVLIRRAKFIDVVIKESFFVTYKKELLIASMIIVLVLLGIAGKKYYKRRKR